jgi:hypothetical protein
MDAEATTSKASKDLADLEHVDVGALPWQASRFPDFDVKVLGYREGEAYINLGRMAPGGRNFAHAHPFHQIRYVLEGEFIINGKTYGPGSYVDIPEFSRYETYSPKGGTWLQVQFWNAKTGAGPTDRQGFTYGTEG